jgi:hypothetical protein
MQAACRRLASGGQSPQRQKKKGACRRPSCGAWRPKEEKMKKEMKEKVLMVATAVAWGLLVPGLVLGFLVGLAIFRAVLG